MDCTALTIGLTILGMIGTGVGFLIGQWRESDKAKRARLGNWRALAVELAQCRDRADSYIRDGVESPLYRLPTVHYATALPALLESNEANDAQAKALVEYFTEAETLNRGFDQVNEARNASRQLDPEVRRNFVKAKRLGRDGELYVAAWAALPADVATTKP